MDLPPLLQLELCARKQKENKADAISLSWKMEIFITTSSDLTFHVHYF